MTGVLAGCFALVVFGLTHAPPNLENVSAARVGALIVALALTLSLMAWLDIPHAPTEATRLIVATGLLRTLSQLGILMLARGRACCPAVRHQPPGWHPLPTVGAAVVVAGIAEAPVGRDELRDFSGDLLSAAMKGWRVILPTYCRRDASPRLTTAAH